MKKEKLMKIIALILCAAMMMCMLTACKEEVIEPEEPEEEVDEFRILYEHFDADTPMLSIGDVEFTWDTVYYYFYQEASALYAEHGQIDDWTAEYMNGESYLEFCLNEAIYYYMRHAAAVEHFAKEYNVELTEEQRNIIEEDRAYDITIFGSEEAMLEYLDEKYMTEDVTRYISEIQLLYPNIMNAIVGENGEKLTEEEIIERADLYYKATKVIAIPKDASNAKANAEAALAELKTATDVEAKMDELIEKYCAADKVEELKTGYVFTRGYFYDDAVEKTLRDLEKGQYYDGVVEGIDNYFIVLREEIDVEAHPFYGTKNGWDENTLRYLSRGNIFQAMIDEWTANAEVTYHDNLLELDIAEILGW